MKKLIDKHFIEVGFILYILFSFNYIFELSSIVKLCVFGLFTIIIAYIEALYFWDKIVFKKDKYKKFIARVIVFSCFYIPIIMSNITTFLVLMLYTGVIYMFFYNAIRNYFKGTDIFYYGKESFFDDLGNWNQTAVIFGQLVILITTIAYLYEKL